jgi:hypothetical protein
MAKQDLGQLGFKEPGNSSSSIPQQQSQQQGKS